MSKYSHTNQLIHEKSPYLLQHAHNPVDWHPWGDAAFEKAKAENKPVLVSIGYATCHWCHVMERESFENEETARLLNEHFVSIKVDREERPDVDAIYMKSIQALGQNGGWPLNVFCTPEGKPFYGGTYFPPISRYNLPSFSDVLMRLNNIWHNEKDKVTKQTISLVEYLQKNNFQQQESALDNLHFEGENRTAKLYAEHYDHLNHGFQFQPQNKFPPSMGLCLLLRHYRRTGAAQSLIMVENTLKAMKHGGIYDQVGGGLCRYSTDYRWMIPHFEKMLYDNSLFVTALIETYQVTNKPEFAEFAQDVLVYMDRDMTSEEGAFYSAEDADSEGVEGKFYVWTPDELGSILDRKTLSAVTAYYNVTQNGNFEGKNNFYVTRSFSEVSNELGIPEPEFEDIIQKARATLLEVRSKRIRPLLDDKILTSWNGLMISAMAKVGRVLDQPERVAKAEKALNFIFAKLKTPDGKLLRRYRDGDARYDGYLFDYASMAVACLELYDATFDGKYVQLARELVETVQEKFASHHGPFYETAEDAEKLLIRQISGYDGVEPSGNSSMAMALLKLSALLTDPELEKLAERIFLGFELEVMDYGLNSSYMMQAFHLYLSGLKEVAVVAPRNHESSKAMLKTIQTGFFPNAVFAFAYEDELAEKAKHVPLLQGRKVVDGKATAYVCRRGTCLAPTNDIEEMVGMLGYEE